MPRRNSNTLQRATKPRASHVIVDTATGKLIDFGSKRQLNESAETQNALIGEWRYIVKPIHR